MEGLKQTNPKLSRFSEDEINIACKEIAKHGSGALNNNKEFLKAIGAIYSGDYTRKSIKRLYVKDCQFINANFDRVAATGSSFLHTIFKDCNFQDANFQYCDFSNSEFYFTNEAYIEGCNFSESDFSNVLLRDLKLRANSFSKVMFDNTIIKDCEITSSTFENAIFRNTIFENIELRNLNIEYADFINVKMKNVTLPFFQIPYVFGCLEYLQNTNDSVWISSKANDKKHISVSEYNKALKNLEIYYTTENEYFPLANIYISRGQDDLALQAILSGLFAAVQVKDFRRLKFFCKLASRNKNFTANQLHEFYEKITTWMPTKNMTNSEFHNYILHIGEIRNILLKDRENQLSAKFTFKTNIESHEGENLGFLINYINEILSLADVGLKPDYIEVRHNSPYELLLQITNNDVTIIGSAIFAIYKILMGANKLVKELYETGNKRLDLKLKQLQIIEKQESIKHSLDRRSIKINEINHFITGVNSFSTSINSSLIHYQLTSDNK